MKKQISKLKSHYIICGYGRVGASAVNYLTRVGAEFVIAVNIYKKNITSTASEIYGYDLLGSFVGAISVSIFLIPLIGIVNVVILVIVLKIISLVWLKKKRKRNY